MRGTEVRGGLPAGSPLPALVQCLALNARPYGALDAWRRRHGDRFTVRSPGMPPLVFLSDPDDVRAVFRAPADVLAPGEGGAAIEPIVGAGSFMLADEAAHLSGRALLKHAFTVRTAQRHAAFLREEAERELATWPRDRRLRVHPWLRSFALRMIVRTIFGAEDPRLPRLTQQLLTTLEVTSSIVLPAPPSRHVPPYRGVWRRFLRDRARTDALLHELIADRRRRPRGPEDTLSLLVDARTEDGAPLPDAYVRDTVMSVVLAGHETTSASLAWAFLLLAHHPAAQRRAADEVDAGGAHPYLTATIREVLRHRPVFAFAIPRAVRRPIEIGGRTYAPPVHLLPCIYLLQHDPGAHPEPHAFRPERFLAGEPAPSHTLPWGGGRKRCPGRHLALEELHAVLRAALAQARIEPATAWMEGSRWRSVIVSPRWGGGVVLRDRSGGASRAVAAVRTPAARSGSATSAGPAAAPPSASLPR